jgi:uncharacterized protein
MPLLNILADYSFVTLIVLAFFAFTAGFIDSVVGGGGLIQVPGMLITFPDKPVPALFGTGKIAALAGTSMAAYQYAKRVRFNYVLLLIVSAAAFVASYLGAKLMSLINVNTLKPVILVILILIAIYTFLKKDLGSVQTKALPINKQITYGVLLGAIVGFYDGFFGPGTGSFLVLGFVALLGFDFVHASAYSKVINCLTNLSALIVFIKQGNYIIEIALLLAIFNITGNILGSRMALKKGNGFVRIIFLVIVTIMIVRYGYDVFMGK